MDNLDEPTVFIVQSQMTWNEDSGRMEPRHDYSSAAEYGKTQYLLSPTAGPNTPDSIIGELHEKLKGFSDSDFIVPTGNPCLIGWAMAVAAMHNEGRATVLQWAKDKTYTPIRFNLCT